MNDSDELILNPGAFGQSRPGIPSFTIRQINLQLSALVEAAFPLLMVEGEIVDLSRPASGHLYFTLRDGAEQLQVAFFRNRHKGAPELKTGLRAMVTGSVSIYSPRSSYQLLAVRVGLKGSGDMQEELRRLKERLEREGLFDPAGKRPIPAFCRRLGVVTSPSGAAIRDILQVIERRHPGADVLIYPTPVQGAEAAPEIARAVRRASADGRCDLLIVGRGGGSREDLWCFNDESVVRAVAECAIPVISAVGHETDFVLTDLSADRRALTPTEAAELAFPRKDLLLEEVRELARRLAQLMHHARESGALRLEDCGMGRLARAPRRLAELYRQRLDELLRGIFVAWGRARERADPAMVATVGAQFALAASRLLARRREELAHLSARLDSISPLALTKRGFHVVETSEGGLLRGETAIREGDILRIRQAMRSIFARVEACRQES